MVVYLGNKYFLRIYCVFSVSMVENTGREIMDSRV